jgi:hypothetical protein
MPPQSGSLRCVGAFQCRFQETRCSPWRRSRALSRTRGSVSLGYTPASRRFETVFSFHAGRFGAFETITRKGLGASETVRGTMPPLRWVAGSWCGESFNGGPRRPCPLAVRSVQGRAQCHRFAGSLGHGAARVSTAAHAAHVHVAGRSVQGWAQSPHPCPPCRSFGAGQGTMPPLRWVAGSWCSEGFNGGPRRPCPPCRSFGAGQGTMPPPMSACRAGCGLKPPP